MIRKLFDRTLFMVRAIMGTYPVKEIFMAEKFNSTITDSEWFVYKSLSPGGYAVDYAFLYTLYRTLSSIKPRNCLEFGLGQTSKMIHQYASYFHANATTIEHDRDWETFFNNGRSGDYEINVRYFDLENTSYKGYETSSYQNCANTLREEGNRYDFILVDGGPFLKNPQTGKKYKYARTQIIDIAKNCLDDNFVILLDDYGVVGIRNTVNDIFTTLKAKGINYVFKEYRGAKTHMLITTPQNRFLTTL